MEEENVEAKKEATVEENWKEDNNALDTDTLETDVKQGETEKNEAVTIPLVKADDDLWTEIPESTRRNMGGRTFPSTSKQTNLVSEFTVGQTRTKITAIENTGLVTGARIGQFNNSMLIFNSSSQSQQDLCRSQEQTSQDDCRTVGDFAVDQWDAREQPCDQGGGDGSNGDTGEAL